MTERPRLIAHRACNLWGMAGCVFGVGVGVVVGCGETGTGGSAVMRTAAPSEGTGNC